MTLYIKKQDGTPFYDIAISKFTFSDTAMSLDTKITTTVIHPNYDIRDNWTRGEYIVYKGVKYFMQKPFATEHKGLVADGSDAKSSIKYNLEFVHPKSQLYNIPFTDIALPNTQESLFRVGGRQFYLFSRIDEFVKRIDANLKYHTNNNGWECKLVDGYDISSAKLPENVMEFEGVFISDALKTAYEELEVPYFIVPNADGITCTIWFGVPTSEVGHTFEFGQGKGLLTNDRTPKNNKVVTKLAYAGSSKNLPFRYPIIKKYADKDKPYYEQETVEHPYGLQYDVALKPTQWVETLRRKVDSTHPEYNPNIELVDYVLADDSYITPNNPSMPLYHYEVFDDIYPTIVGLKNSLGEPIDTFRSIVTTEWNDTIDKGTGDIEQSYFEVELNALGFDLWGSSNVQDVMTFSMTSGDCQGSNFKVAYNEEMYEKCFYKQSEKGEPIFDANLPIRWTEPYASMFPDSTNEPIQILLSKDIESFGESSIMPNVLQKPKVGDTYVIINIDLPQKYIDDAQKRLDDAGTQYLKENNYDQYDYPLKFDKVFLEQRQHIADQIDTATLVPFKYKDDVYKMSVQSITITYGSETLPNYDVKLTDELTITMNPVSEVSNGLAKIDKIVSGGMVKNSRQVANFFQNLKKVEEGIFDVDGNNKVKLVEALLIKANSIFIGSENRNFSPIDANITLQNNVFSVTNSSIIHYNISRADEYNVDDATWYMQPQTIVLDSKKEYYVYIKANYENSSADWELLDKTEANQKSYKDDLNKIFWFYWGQLNIVGNVRTAYPEFGMSVFSGGTQWQMVTKSPNFILTKDQFIGMMIDWLNAKIYMGDGAEIVAKKISFRQPDGTDYDAQEAISDAQVTASKAKEAVDNLEVGGVNLLDNSEEIRNSEDRFLAISVRAALSDYVGRNVVFSFEGRINEGGVERDIYVYPFQESGISIKDNKYMPFTKEWQRFTLETTAYDWGQKEGLTTGEIAFYDRIGDNNYSIRNLKIETGNVATAWSKSINDTNAEIADAKKAGTDANAAVNNLNIYVDGAFKDGVIDQSEAKAIGEQLKSLNETASSADQSYTVVYNNTLLTGVAKTNLGDARINLVNSRSTLISYINTIVTQGTISESEKNTYNTYYSNYNSNYGTFSQRLNEATKYIEDVINGKIDNLEIGGVNLLDNSEEVRNSEDRFLAIPVRAALSDYVGRNVVFSFEGRINGSGTERDIDVYPFQESGISIKDNKYMPFTKEWQRFTLETTAYDWGQKEGLTTGEIAFYDRIGDNNYSIRNLKIETGNIATAWSKSISDQQLLANKALQQLNDISDDNKLTPQEKPQVQKEWEEIQNIYQKNLAQGKEIGVSTSAYTSAYTVLYAYITPLLADMNATSTIVGSTFNNLFTAFYGANTDLTNAISSKLNKPIAGDNLLLKSGVGHIITSNYISYKTSKDLINGNKYTFVCDYKTTGNQNLHLSWQIDWLGQNDGVRHVTFTFNSGNGVDNITLLNNPAETSDANPLTVRWACLYEGDVRAPQTWVASKEDVPTSLDYLTEAFADNTEIDGGVVGTTLLQVGLTDTSGKRQIKGGIDGTSSNVGVWTGGNHQNAIDGDANIILYKDGNAKIGIMDIDDTAITIQQPDSDETIVLDTTPIETLDPNGYTEGKENNTESSSDYTRDMLVNQLGEGQNIDISDINTPTILYTRQLTLTVPKDGKYKLSLSALQEAYKYLRVENSFGTSSDKLCESSSTINYEIDLNFKITNNGTTINQSTIQSKDYYLYSYINGAKEQSSTDTLSASPQSILELKAGIVTIELQTIANKLLCVANAQFAGNNVLPSDSASARLFFRLNHRKMSATMVALQELTAITPTGMAITLDGANYWKMYRKSNDVGKQLEMVFKGAVDPSSNIPYLWGGAIISTYNRVIMSTSGVFKSGGIVNIVKIRTGVIQINHNLNKKVTCLATTVAMNAGDSLYRCQAWDLGLNSVQIEVLNSSNINVDAWVQFVIFIGD